MATTISTRISYLGSEVTGQPLATNTRETPLSVKLSYTDGVEGVNMVWSATEGDSPGIQVDLLLRSLADDRGTVQFSHVHGYTFNIRSGSIEFPKHSDVVGTNYYRYQPLTNDAATTKWLLTGPGQLTFSSAAAAGDAITSLLNNRMVFWPSTGADYDVIIYGVGTIV